VRVRFSVVENPRSGTLGHLGREDVSNAAQVAVVEGLLQAFGSGGPLALRGDPVEEFRAFITAAEREGRT
jgi:hypothetical protein